MNIFDEIAEVRRQLADARALLDKYRPTPPPKRVMIVNALELGAAVLGPWLIIVAIVAALVLLIGR